MLAFSEILTFNLLCPPSGNAEAVRHSIRHVVNHLVFDFMTDNFVIVRRDEPAQTGDPLSLVHETFRVNVDDTGFIRVSQPSFGVKSLLLSCGEKNKKGCLHGYLIRLSFLTLQQGHVSDRLLMFIPCGLAPVCFQLPCFLVSNLGK